MPKTPLKTPTKKLSDVKIRLMSFLRAPIDLRTPISFVRSVTLIYKTTKIIIAQRIGSVEDAHLIIVMDNGRISAAGTHEELLRSSTIYQEVYEQQTNGNGGEDQ